MKRGDIAWAELPPPAGRRPVAVVTRSSAIEHLGTIVVAPVTSTVRGIASEISVGRAEGLTRDCVINCDQLVSIVRSAIDDRAVGSLSPEKVVELDRALRFALGIVF